METAEPEQIQLGRYRLGRTLGAGGMGVVYLAQDTKLDRPVAIKKLRRDATSASARGRIQSEAQLLAKLNHSNIVQLYDVLEEDDGIALVMEYVEGTTLREWMREHIAPLREKIGLLMQICDGLGEAHALGIIHRDLKPDNILITNNGVAKITDFGIAKSQDQQDLNLTKEDHVAGTLGAMSPEQIQGKPLDLRSDLFSLGTIAYELLCGTKPFDTGEGNFLALAGRVINEPHTAPQQAWSKIPEPLAVLLDKLLHKDPTQRPESAQLVYDALEFMYRVGEPDADTEEFSATITQLLSKPRNNHWRKVAAFAVAVVVIAGGVWGWSYLNRLEPQYIAVLPAQIEGEAPELTDTLVRQALSSSVGHLKSSALVAFTPRPEESLEAQIKSLREKGVTDVLVPSLECARTRCEIEIQLLDAADSLIRNQTSFAFLPQKRQESEYQISEAGAHLFEQAYLKHEAEQGLMSDDDYQRYLKIAARLDNKDLKENDLKVLGELILRYPDNINLYRAHASAAAKLYVASDNFSHIQSGLAMLERARTHNIDKIVVLELELWLRSYDGNREAFDQLLSKLQALNFPPAQLINKYARFLYIQGEYQDGIKYSSKAAELNPSAENLYLIALNQFGSGNYQEAEKTLTNSIASHPEHWTSYATLGAIHVEMGKYTAAESTINSIPPPFRNWRTHSNLGVSYFLQGRYELALDAYTNALRMAPDNVLPLYNIAEIYLILGKENQAEKHFRKISQITEEKTGIRDKKYRSIALAYLGRIQEAISLAHHLNQEIKDDTLIKYFSAQIFSLAGEPHSASIYIEQLLEQGMGADWFSLPVFHKLCTQPATSKKVTKALCH
ncbi:serine/threonine-protein kinase [Microbulbifer rhizosphaerae]|uniref:Serine/threonine-protein kinase n=1 Tax=Microbulbifer rhizosphaerae TaxID=1562603 RepID=A0A7W4W8P8_9GAMM|nr:serine/threonine-protein kinase [Microbulbifer rhizosphaerae]MBB3059775.1 serine/threonine-protein kinase [Microbulbifer rhizosphaerae]